MQKSATANSVTVPRGHAAHRARLVHLYTGLVSVTGSLIFIYVLTHLPEDRVGLAVFAIMAVILELTSVELFKSSRSSVSLSEVIAIASIMAFGPLAAVLINLISGLTTSITTSLRSNHSEKDRATRFRRTTFNMGMLAISAMTAGSVFALSGEVPGHISHLAILPVLIITTVVEWSVNAILLIGVISLQTGKPPVEIWNRDIRWQAPVSIAGGVLGGGILALAYNMFGVLGILIVLLPILSTNYAFRLYKNNMRDYVDGLETLNEELKATMVVTEKANLELTEANQAIRRLNSELFQSLAKVFDMRDPYVGGHAAQVAAYAVAIATEMGLPQERIEGIRQSGYLHDIGKLAIPEAILHKPRKLTEIEYEFVKKHADIGADLLVSTQGLQHLAPFVRGHHERWDGRGYPLGLAGEEIPLEARILNLCDSVESMASDRPYHRGMSTNAIIDEIQDCRGTQFDPAVVDVFIHLIQRNGPSFVTNSARSVTQQYAASLLASESITHNMFEWILEKNAEQQPTPVNNSSITNQSSTSASVFLGRSLVERYEFERRPLEI